MSDKIATLSLSEYDRGIVLLMSKAVPWSGGEDAMTARLAAETALKLSALAKRGPDFPVDKLDRKPVPYKLPRPHVEVLIHTLCGGGGAPSPEVGPIVAELVGRIRRQCPRPKAP